MSTEKYRRSGGRWRMFAVILLLISIGLLVGIIIMAVVKDNNKDKQLDGQKVPYCGGEDDIQLGEPDNPSVFHDLTSTEVDGLMNYLHSQKVFNLVNPEDAKVNNSYVFLAEVYIPTKAKVLDYLDNNGSKPDREAIVTIFRGDKRPPVVEEYIVGPLPSPNHVKDVPGHRRPIPFNLRPYTGPELVLESVKLESFLHNTLYDLMLESFGGSFGDCGDHCLMLHSTASFSSAVSGVGDGRMTWYTLRQKADFFILHPLNFAVLVNFEQEQQTTKVKKVWYNGHTFDTLEELATAYSDGSVGKMKVPFPQDNDQLFSKLTRRGQPFHGENKRAPVQVEPDGKRYAVHHNHIEYMGWAFYYRMSSVAGPQIYDVRFRNERIAYEISLQEIAVLYSGYKPAQMFPDYLDSSSLMGPQDKGLVPGIDCPAEATFMDTSFVLESSKKPSTFKNAFCVFELNMGYPLRRHQSYSMDYGFFFEGMPNMVLTLRSVFTVVNYDYIFDFIFFQNGVVQVRAVSTGYILATFHTDQEAPYGAQVHDNINGNLHTHLFNFKVDIDIKGKTNRFETMDIAPTSRPNEFSTNPNAQYHMTKFTRDVKKTEQAGAYKFNFDTPKYLTFYNEQERNTYGNPKAYRLVNRGMVKQLFAEGEGNEPAASWSRYQVAVTKYKESERRSSSMYAYRDSADPVVQFQKFIDDNESILDEDLVAWVTMGVHHIPHTEDLPVTPSPGMDLSFFLLPYNYFSEDPAMASKSAVRIDINPFAEPKDRIRLTRYGPTEEKQCIPKKNDFFDMMAK